MDIASFLLSVALAALLLYLLVRLPLAILGNLRAGHRFRQGLASTLGKLRLSRMLRYLGIDEAAYLHNQQALDIRQHMARCDACDAKERCDQVLAEEPPADKESLGFCANIDELDNLRQSR
ncbi:MAG: hypothetical protein H6953_10235 [Chromatiaceae bacterium]|nr:hypothetical protein [Gammaproteobacteria bacterium]MCP5305816.1 hypothetical protein [Chromatiaceae bacterium]MCP5312672.1 hypothetical protein [Chromatiaceae bacterium]